MPRHYTYEQKRIAIERELAFRRTYYPKRVAAGKMRQETADFEIAVMEAIAADYARVEGPDRLMTLAAKPRHEPEERLL